MSLDRVPLYVLAAASISFLTYVLTPTAPAPQNTHRDSPQRDNDAPRPVVCPPQQAAERVTVLNAPAAISELSALDVESKKAVNEYYLGSWKDLDLEPLHKVHRAMDDNFKKKGWDLREGHSAHKIDELRMYFKLAQLPKVKRICEIGFNAGHSAALWLMANPEAEVIMFDIGDHNYIRPIFEMLRDSDKFEALGIKNAKNRFKLVLGSSATSLATFRMEHPDVKCDLMSIDGRHTTEMCMHDMIYMKPLANPHWNIVMLDDSNCGQKFGYCKNVEAAMVEAERKGLIQVVDRATYTRRGEGIIGGLTVATYPFPNEMI